MSRLFRTILSVGLTFIELAGRVLRPALYLWPWLMGTAAFAAVLATEQGQALAAAFVADPVQPAMTAAAIVATDLLLLVACTLGMVAVIGRISPDPPVRDLKHGPRFDVVVDGFWTISLSSGFGIIFAVKTQFDAAIAAVVAVAIVCIASWIWLAYSVVRPESLPRRILHTIHRHQVVLALVVAVVATVPLAIGGLLTITVPSELGKLGPLLICMIGLAALSTLSGAVLVVVPICAGRPWAGIVLVSILIVTELSTTPPVDEANSLIVYSKESKARDADEVDCESPPGSTRSALINHIPKQSPTSLISNGSVYLVSAEGGGIRAAYWTGVSLGRLDADSEDDFGDHVALVSGVSGGSLGIAAWLAARERRDLTPQARLQLIKRFLSSDFLSPLMAGFLFLDVPRIIFGPLWFRARRDEVFEKAIADRWTAVGNTTFFIRPYYKLCVAGFKAPPGIIFNATDALTGRYVPLTKLRDLAQTTIDQELSKSTIGVASVAQIVHASARFPYLSPAAEVGLGADVIFGDAAKNDLINRDMSTPMTEAEEEAGRQKVDREVAKIRSEKLMSRIAVLVDGGYFDNTGLTPTVHALRYIGAQSDRENRDQKLERQFSTINVRIVHLANDPGQLCLPPADNDQLRESTRVRRFETLTKPEIHCRYELSELEQSFRSSPLQWFLTPLEALLSVRQAHSALMKDSVKLDATRYNLEHPRTEQVFDEYSVSEELKDAYRPAGQPSADDPDLFSPAAVLERDLIQESTFSGSAYDAWARNDMSVEVMLQYLRKLDAWHQEIQNLAAPCFKNPSVSAPPLGWALTKANQSLLDCLLDKAVLRRDMHPAPYPPLDTLRQFEKPRTYDGKNE